MGKNKFKLTYSQTIVLVFLLVIICGSLLLCLPISSRTNEVTPFIDALVTATSSTCVTGLIAADTYTHWSYFGQIVILLLIQFGGIGVMTIIFLFSMFLKRKVGLHERQLLVQTAGMMKLGGVVSIIKRIIIMSLAIEAVGILILSLRFCRQMGFWEGLYYSFFHSISAFCNAGFDLMGQYEPYSSLTSYVGDVLVSVTIASLIIIGGIGFVVWDDILSHKLNFRKYELHSKIVLSVTGSLILLGWVLFFIFEYNGVMADFTLKEKLTASFFQSVSPRTAGFNTIDLTKISDAGIFLTIVLMFIGGSSGSTAGGIKTTTIFVVLLNIVNAAKKKHSMVAFKRRLSDEMLKPTCAIISIAAFAIIISTLTLCAVESIPLKEALFETASALGTVGLTLNITPTLSAVGKVIIVVLMFAGRVGWITLLLALARKHVDPPIERPVEKIMVG